MNYSEYLQSEHWQSFRKSVLEHYGYTCQVCNNKGKTVHHRTYKNIGREKINDVVTLCKHCHKTIHKLLNKKFFK